MGDFWSPDKCVEQLPLLYSRHVDAPLIVAGSVIVIDLNDLPIRGCPIFAFGHFMRVNQFCPIVAFLIRCWWLGIAHAFFLFFSVGR